MPHVGTWTKRRSGHGVEQEAHSPHTMGEAAKGPAGVAGFLKEKSQNELLRGRLASDIPIPPVQTFQGPVGRGVGGDGTETQGGQLPP